MRIYHLHLTESVKYSRSIRSTCAAYPSATFVVLLGKQLVFQS